MKMVDGIEKGILRRAFSHVLPHDVVYRKKSAYPSTQHPAYDQAIRAWARHILDDPDAPIQPLIDKAVVQAMLEKPDFGIAPFAERLIHFNEWLAKYQVTLAL
jgi:asparagine synthase (glutamine-hydrolysing)